MIDAEHIMKYIDEYVIPIELPSDEEIEIDGYTYRAEMKLSVKDSRIVEKIVKKDNKEYISEIN